MVQPSWIEPELATLTKERFSDPAWITERKLDGERCLAFVSGDSVRLLTRNKKSITGTYPELAAALGAQRAGDFIVDGEIVAFDGAQTSFARLQQRMQLAAPLPELVRRVPVHFYLFDVVYAEGQDLRRLPLLERKQVLRRLLSFGAPLRFSTHRTGKGEAHWQDACRKGWEGVIAKRADSPYDGGRSKNWLKFKCVRDQEFVVGGYTSPQGSRIGLGALLLGYYDGRDLVYAGKVGTGFDDATLRSLHERLAPIEVATPPFTRGLGRESGARWVRPELVAQIGFTEWTRDGKLRHPRYQGLRIDKSPDEVVRETH